MLRKKTATYALLAMYEIARQHRGVKDPLGVRAGDVAAKYKLPKAYVAKILSQLANAGVLNSGRGPRGGFKLNKPTNEITLFDVFSGVGAMSYGPSAAGAVKGLPAPVQSALSRALQQAGEQVKELFSRTTLADFLGQDS
jgi:Rrf2 family protein